MKRLSRGFVTLQTGLRKLRTLPHQGEGVIRKAVLSDLAGLDELEMLCFKTDRFSKRQYWHLMTDAHALVGVYESQRRIIGSVVILFRTNSRLAHLYSLSVHPDSRRRGIGKALLLWAPQKAKSRGCQWISLEVKVTNQPALALYKKFGFQPVARLPRYYRDGTDAIRMLAPIKKTQRSPHFNFSRRTSKKPLWPG